MRSDAKPRPCTGRLAPPVKGTTVRHSGETELALHSLQYETGSRVNRAISQVERAQAVLEFTNSVFGHFRGFEDEDAYYHLQALVNRTGLIALNDSDTDSVGTAIRLIANRRLPELLCVSLVSAFETCLQDIAEVEIRARHSVRQEAAERKAYNLMRGGPQNYLGRLRDLLDLRFLCEDDWQSTRELVATRNIVVHSYPLKADAGYVRQAGPFARFQVGENVEVDAKYLIEQNGKLRFLLQHFLYEEPRRDV